jgi:antitoxin component YwqK of YwqJK toxin-antitoxin module
MLKMKKLFLIFALIGLISGNLFSQDDSDINLTDEAGRKQGSWIEKDPTYTAKGTYTNDLKDGIWTSYFNENEMLYKVENFKSGIKQGISLEFSKRANLVSEQYFVNDLPDGVSRTYTQSGLPLTVKNYKSGNLDGIQITYYENTFNKKSEEASYKNGVKDGISKWYDMEGHVIAEYIYVNGSLEGEQKTFYPAGKIRSSELFQNNQNHGAAIEYFESGNIKISGQYLKGEKDGKWTEYDESGKIISSSTFVKGKEK